jgi:beta-aspartyl-peptidase (threonine type)
VQTIRNPINAAIAVMNKSEHVMLTAKGAETFAKSQGLEIVDPQYFYSERRWKSLQRVKAKDIGSVEEFKDYKFGTVGAVALDKNGDIVAGTSTGGMTNKRWNRIGDSPIIGAGTYANNNTCGVSCTGHGEYFIRYAVAHDISAAMEYKGLSVEEAGNLVINDKLVKAGGDGGAIILDKNGNVAMPFNSAGMYRGYIKSDGTKEVKIYKE